MSRRYLVSSGGALLFVAWSLLCSGPAVLAAQKAAGAIHVELVHAAGKWQLLRDGAPYVIKGAGGGGPKQLLRAAGGNSVRTWDADDIGAQLDEAQQLGLTVAVGIWLGHKRHGFDYSNLDQVAGQYEKARKAVLRYKDHPAVLLWGVGNEMEQTDDHPDGDDAATWSAVNNIAAMIKKIDTHHPIMTVIAEIGGRRVEAIHRLCPDIDIVGINSYGGVASLPERYRKAGGTKPYVVTEFGPAGFWEVGKNAAGVVAEPTSTKKAESYRNAYASLASDSSLCLGSYAFIWGHKMEATLTWFGMLLPDETKLAVVDTMTELWSGQPPKNLCPRIDQLSVDGPAEVAPGGTVRVKLQASDPEGDPLRVKWTLTRDDADYQGGGDQRKAPPGIAEAVTKGDLTGAELRLPAGGGNYRLYVCVRDAAGAAVANVPLRVRGPEAPIKAEAAKLPLTVLADGLESPPYIPSGWMGEIKAIRLDEKCTDQPHTGKTCLKVEHGSADRWAGVVWQHPVNDWGDKPGGFDLTGAKQLVFWARGKQGGEKVAFGFGLLGAEKKYRDTGKGEISVTLATTWTEYTIPLTGLDLTRIKSGFYYKTEAQGKPLTFYVADVEYR